MCFYFDENDLSIAVLKDTMYRSPSLQYHTSDVELSDSVKWVIPSLQIVSWIQVD